MSTVTILTLVKPWAVMNAPIKGQLNKYCADGVDVHIVGGVADGIFAGTEQEQQVFIPEKQN